MRNSSDVKDKNIRLENFKYRARVEYYNGRVNDCGLFESITLAQKELLKYPRDVWDGIEKTSYKHAYSGEDKPDVRRHSENTETKRPINGGRKIPGRSFAGLV